MFKRSLRFSSTFFLLTFCGVLFSAPQSITAFRAETWKSIIQSNKKQVIVFSTTDCAHCPEAILQIANDLKKSSRKIDLVAVVMDGFEHPDYVFSAPHYAVAQHIFAFDGRPQVIRYSVNPDWLGMTPYIVFLNPNAKPIYQIGKPSRQQMNSFINQ